MIQIFKDGNLKWTITTTDNSSENIIVLPKNLAKECNMTASGFDEIFYACLTTAKNNHAAYEAAEEIHMHYFEKRKYSDYQSFKSAKSKRFNR